MEKVKEKPVQNPVSIDVSYLPKVCFALQQNAIPLIRQVTIRNESDEDLEDVICSISSTPSFFDDYKKHFSSLAPGKEYTITDLDTTLNYGMLSEVSEKVRGDFRVDLFTEKGEEQDDLLSQRFPVEVLPYDVWPGGAIIPELLAAYATPNNDAVEDIMVRAGDLLQSRTGTGGLSGYQSRDKKYVYEMIRAVFDGVRQIGLTYSNPPANFEQSGQRVRFPQKIHESKLATCLDSALLFAAVLEQCGLNALVLLHEGHAYTGCHLIDETFPNPIVDDLQSVRKRWQLDELIVFETTLAVKGGTTSFAQAVQEGEKHLGLDTKFHMAMDVSGARSSGIVPLPILRGELDLSQRAKVKSVEGIVSLKAESRQFAEAIVVDKEDETPQTRIDNWKRHLLDMTLRNRLLNFRENKQTIPIACPSPSLLEDAIAGERGFQLLELPALMGSEDPRSQALMEDDALKNYLLQQLDGGRLRCSLTETELNRRLLAIFRSSRTDLEEGGVNTLFLTLGFLEWLDQGGEKRKAPLIMLPVQIERKSVRHGFKLQRYDDDVAVNVTLLEMLRRDFQLEVPGVDPPPEDDSGIDVARIMQLFRQAVKGLKGWEVLEEVWLGRFSFSKFIMWKDLNNRLGELISNPVVNHLVNHPGEAYDDGVVGVSPEDIDPTYGYENLFCPMSADSSQLAAVLTAERGKSFVLHGPPGTGKSQTITNMIAHCLTRGKRVLFVSEKRAALEVVHRRLCSLGLEPFCLELHSNKSGKMDVLQQFKRAIDFGLLKTPGEWEETARRLNAARDVLNKYQTELHRVYDCGFTPYRLFSTLIGEKEPPQCASVPRLGLKALEKMTESELNTRKDACRTLEIRCRELTSEHFNVFSFVETRQWTPNWQREIMAATEGVSEAFKQLHTCLTDQEKCWQLNIPPLSKETVDKTVDLAKWLVGAPAVPKSFIDSGWDEFSKAAREAIAAGQRRDEIRATLADFRQEQLAELSIDSLIQAFKAAGPKFFLLRWLEQRKIRSFLQRCQKIGAPKIPLAKVFSVLQSIREFNLVDEKIKTFPANYKERLGEYWDPERGEWEKARTLISFGDRIDDCIEGLEVTLKSTGQGIRPRVGDLLEKGSDYLAEDSDFATKTTALATAWETCLEELQGLQKIADATEEPFGDTDDFIEGALNGCETIIKEKEDLRSWCLWLQAKDQALELGLDELIHPLETGALKSNLEAVFMRRFQEELLDKIITDVPVLCEFVGDEHDMRVEKFNELDRQYSELSKQLVVATLGSRLPGARRREAAKDSAIGLLQRECQKKSRHLPVRTLLEKIESVLPSLKPCMLMSPLSIAQYLPASQSHFDIVVFDEASQIPVWDAIGAIARAPQCVVVGDPKQLPPTNFFNRSDSDDDFLTDDDSFTELESILDECISTRMGNSHLRWHYRSRHESLISFSNYHYYDNRLHTFPSAIDSGVGTSFKFVGGTYDKGKSRTNKMEAEALVEEIVRRLSCPENCSRSIGVVTFSQAQQSLIEDLLDKARSDHPEIERYFTDEVTEPVFVKNLENVQGDERDVILFSICYAKSESGRLSMNFGPLNRDGGERRLNVAITRAREEVVVFSSIRAEDIDLSRTKAVGVTHLKAYLKYAEKGVQSFGNITESPVETDDFESPFERAVAEFLTEAGYPPHTQVGCSGYRIDLAVPHPDKPGLYILGVECDGAAYHSSATAQDRDQLRQSVLESLGWTIHRVWSTAWWHSPEKTRRKLLEAVKDALYAAENNDVNSHLGQTNAAGNSTVEPENTELYPELEDEDIPPPSVEDCRQSEEYPSVQYTTVDDGGIEAFVLPEARQQISKQMLEIVEREGPILKEVLHKRTTDRWDIKRISSRVKPVLEECEPKKLMRQSSDGRIVFWAEGTGPASYDIFRYPNRQEEDDYRRLLNDIPVQELANAMYYVMREYHSCKAGALFRETANIFNVSRVTKKSEAYLTAALQNLKERDIIE